jgi:hypothetical protein
MSAVLIPWRLDPAYTDADWAQDIIVCVDDESTVENWVGSAVKVNLVRQGLPAAAYELTVGAGLAAPTAQVPVAIRVPKAQMETFVPGAYRGEVRRLALDGSYDAAVLFEVRIQAGVSDLQPPEFVGGTTPFSGGAGASVKVVRSALAPKIIRGGGVVGPRGPARIERISATAYTLQPADAFSVLVFTASANVEVTVPAGLSPVFECQLVKDGSGDVYVRGGAGVAVVAAGGRTGLVAPFSAAELLRLDPVAESYLVDGGTGVPPGPGALGLFLTPANVVELTGPDVLLATVVGTSGAAPYTFGLVDDDGGRFALVGAQLRTGAVPITSADGFERVVSINVTDADDVSSTISKRLPVLPAASLIFDRPTSAALCMVI